MEEITEQDIIEVARSLRVHLDIARQYFSPEFINDNTLSYGGNGVRGTVLHAVICRRSWEVVNKLLKCGADINMTNSHNETPLKEANILFSGRDLDKLDLSSEH